MNLADLRGLERFSDCLKRRLALFFLMPTHQNVFCRNEIMSTCFSRPAPSPRYRELLTQYVQMHVHGEQFQHIPPEQTFAGQSLPRHAKTIKSLINAHAARTILDYGSGKGQQYQPVRVQLDDGREFPSIPAYWAVNAITCYDPGFAPHSRLPEGKFDGVVSTDVLEHCPEDDLPWIVEEIFGYARKFVFANVACYPAMKRLSNGENAHCTIQTTAWWESLIKKVAQRHPTVRYQVLLERPEQTAGGRPKLVVDTLSG